MIEHNGFWSKNLAFVQPLSFMQMVVWLQSSFKSWWIWQTAHWANIMCHNLDKCFSTFLMPSRHPPWNPFNGWHTADILNIS